jgi:hypothetical protein
MDGGYVVAPEGTDVELGNGVRHIAQLENGEVFVAFEGDRPCAGALLIPAEDSLPWWWHKVRTVAPSGPEAFYIVTAEQFENLTTGIIAAATRLSSGNVLVQTNGHLILGAIWGSVAVSYIDERLATV